MYILNNVGFLEFDTMNFQISLSNKEEIISCHIVKNNVISEEVVNIKLGDFIFFE